MTNFPNRGFYRGDLNAARNDYTTSGYVYLASPYSAPTLQQRVNNFMLAQETTTELFKRGFAVYSPIVSWHHIAEMEDLPKDFEFWQHQNDALLDGAAAIAVLTITGFSESKGVRYELERARKADKICLTIGYYDKPLELMEHDLRHWTPDSVLSQ